MVKEAVSFMFILTMTFVKIIMKRRKRKQGKLTTLFSLQLGVQLSYTETLKVGGYKAVLLFCFPMVLGTSTLP